MTCSALVLTHLKGQSVRAAVSFVAEVDGEDAYVEPTSVVFKVKKPDDTIVTKTYGVDAEVVRSEEDEDQGDGTTKPKVTFHLDIDASAAGTWYVRVTGSGTYQAAAEGSFVVAAGNF